MDFTYNGTSASSLGIIVNSMDWYVKPERKVDELKVQGRDGTSVVDDSYLPITIKTRITIKSLSNINFIMSWLTGNGQLTFSGDSGKYRNAYVFDAINFSQNGSTWEASFEFYCADPFRYVSSESNITKTTFPATYTNAGNLFAKPLLKITGSGTVSLTIGASTITIILDNAYVYVDSDAMDVYYGTTLKNRNATGTFPTFSIGSNSITKTGTITELVITPRTRYL